MRLPTFVIAAIGCVVLAGSAPPPETHSHHVAPGGRQSGDGSVRRPWDLATALAGASGKIRSGDTVWLHTGTYRGAFRTALKGDLERPIVFRQAGGERATIDGTLLAEGANLTFWGFEITQTNPSTYGLEARTNGGRFINLIIHHAGSMGVSFWTPGENAELYGCVVYENGTHENLDHGVYVHNLHGTKRLTDNVFFNNLAYGIHVYATSRNPSQRGIRLEGNVAFENGTISRRYRAKGNVIVGGDVPMSEMQVLNNLLYFSGREGENLRIGYGAVQNGDAVVHGNLIWGGATALRMSGTWARVDLDSNIIGGAQRLIRDGSIAGAANLLYESPQTPSRPAVFVRPNQYERGRAHVVVYNWSEQASVKIDLSGVLATGDEYEIRSVRDVFGAPLVRGTYAGDSISVPVKRFGAFLVTLSTSSSRRDTHR